MDEQAWLKEGAAILTNIKEWRCAHPKATFVEIEDEIHRRMMELEAQVLQDAAQASESREWGKRRTSQPRSALPVRFPSRHVDNISTPCKAMEGRR